MKNHLIFTIRSDLKTVTAQTNTGAKTSWHATNPHDGTVDDLFKQIEYLQSVCPGGYKTVEFLWEK